MDESVRFYTEWQQALHGCPTSGSTCQTRREKDRPVNGLLAFKSIDSDDGEEDVH